ncbi:MAG TPA: hypothetical protein VF815_09515 [Myxococcaceae bacterium]
MASAASVQDFTHRYMPLFGKRVHRLGLSGNYGIDPAGLHAAIDRGGVDASPGPGRAWQAGAPRRAGLRPA